MRRRHVDRHVFVLSVDTATRRNHLEIPARKDRETREENQVKECFEISVF